MFNNISGNGRNRSRNGAGKLSSGLAPEIVGRKWTEHELWESEARLRAITDMTADGIVTIDEQGIIESLNPAAERLFGYLKGVLVGQHFQILMPSPHRENSEDYVANLHETCPPTINGCGRELTARRKDGSTFPIDLSVAPVRLPGRRIYLAIFRDITERKRLEKQVLEISEAEQRRLGQDLHDCLCQQLAGIAVRCHTVQRHLEKTLPREARNIADIARFIQHAIRQTRGLARGLVPVVSEPAGLMRALEEFAGNVEAVLGVVCQFRCRSPVLLQDHAVATHLFRIAQEAVQNAIKHGKAKRLMLLLKATDHRIILQVKDDGIGFPKTRSKEQGMGLLGMQYRARMIDASLAIDRNGRRGTTVNCSVPLRVGPP